MTAETDELAEVWELIRELNDISTRLDRAAVAAIESLGLRTYDERKDPET